MIECVEWNKTEQIRQTQTRKVLVENRNLKKQETPRLWGKRSADSSEIVHTVLGSLEDYLHNNLTDYRFQVESLLELLYCVQN